LHEIYAKAIALDADEGVVVIGFTE